MRSFIFLSIVVLCAAQQGSRRRARPEPQAQPVEELPPPPVGDALFASECPEPYGFFADAEQCDKYYECRNWTLSEKLCRDGYAFVDYHFNVERCDYLFNVNCTDRPKLQTPKPTEHCPRQNGFFPHEDKTICNKFYQCNDGLSNPHTCNDALIFNPKSGTCEWPESAKRPGCTAKDVLNFTCPKQSPAEAAVNLHPRYPDQNDCQYFFVCLNGVTPRRNGCMFGQVFSIELSACDQAENVLECADWYLDDPRYQEYLRYKTTTTTTTSKPAQIKTRRRRPTRPVRPRPTQAEIVPAQEAPSVQPVSPLRRKPARPSISVTDLVGSKFPEPQEVPVRQPPSSFQSLDQAEPAPDRFLPHAPVEEKQPGRIDPDRFFGKIEDPVPVVVEEAPIEEEPAPRPGNRFRQRPGNDRLGPFRRRFNAVRRRPVADQPQ